MAVVMRSFVVVWVVAARCLVGVVTADKSFVVAVVGPMIVLVEVVVVAVNSCMRRM